jgi:hypothetical protein
LQSRALANRDIPIKAGVDEMTDEPNELNVMANEMAQLILKRTQQSPDGLTLEQMRDACDSKARGTREIAVTLWQEPIRRNAICSGVSGLFVEALSRALPQLAFEKDSSRVFVWQPDADSRFRIHELIGRTPQHT